MILFVYKIATNQLDSGGHCAKALRATQLILIAKKPSEIRPISVGETLRRIAGRLIIRMHKDKIITALGLHQYAMQSNGTTKLVFAARNILEKNPAWIMVCPDAKNALNSRSDG